MIKNSERLDHALHNEKVCNYLSLVEEYSDWIITSAFYSALHFVSYKIFPFNVQAPGNKKTAIESVDHYFNYNNPKRISKHELLAKLVSEKCDGISEDYDRLLDLSMNARYVSYRYPKEISNMAMSLMRKIKTSCTTPDKK